MTQHALHHYSVQSNFVKPCTYQPFAHTNCFLNSFIPHAVSRWNTLPELVVSAPSLSTFKHSLKQYYYMYKCLYIIIHVFRVQSVLAMLFCTQEIS